MGRALDHAIMLALPASPIVRLIYKEPSNQGSEVNTRRVKFVLPGLKVTCRGACEGANSVDRLFGKQSSGPIETGVGRPPLL